MRIIDAMMELETCYNSYLLMHDFSSSLECCVLLDQAAALLARPPLRRFREVETPPQHLVFSLSFVNLSMDG